MAFFNDIVETMAGTQNGIITFKPGTRVDSSILISMGVPNVGADLSEAYMAACKANNTGKEVKYDIKNRCILGDISAESTQEVKQQEVVVVNKVEENKEDVVMSDEIRRQLAFGTDEGKDEVPIIAGEVIDGKELVEKFRGQSLRVTNMDTYIKKGNTLEDGTYVAIQVDVTGENGLKRWVTAPYRCLENIKAFIKENKYTADGKYSGANFVKLFQDEEYYVEVADQDAKLAKDGEHWNAKYDIYKK